MKSAARVARVALHPSSPARGMWIEIADTGGIIMTKKRSSPARGMWIEITRIHMAASVTLVIPRTGDVD